MQFSWKSVFIGTLAMVAVPALCFATWYISLHPLIQRIPDDPSRTDKISFMAVGDQGTGFPWQWAVGHGMESQAERQGKLNFVALLGDNFYTHELTRVDSWEWLTKFEWPYSGKFLNAVPFYAVLGNHDHGQTDAGGEEFGLDGPEGHGKWPSPETQIEYARQQRGSNRWRMPDWYYSEDFGRIGNRPLLRVVFLDTNLSHKLMLKQAQFIRDQFQGTDNGPIWKIVVGHHPVVTYGKHHQDRNDMLSVILPALQDVKVDLYLAAHDHNQQVIARAGEPFYFINGGGGAKTYAIKQSAPDLLFARADRGFLSVTADRANLSVGEHDLRGNTLVKYRLSRACTWGTVVCLQRTTEFSEQ